jgi:hypothetical protein
MDISTLLGLLAGLSVATERITEIIKGFPLFSKWLTTPKQDTRQEELRKAVIQIIAITVGTWLATLVKAQLATALHFQNANAVPIPVCFLVGAMTSGGSALWNSALDITRQINQQKQALTAQMQAAPASLSRLADASTVTRHIALVPNTTEVDIDDLHQVTAALSIQITRDFGPLWAVTATVEAFTSESEVPPGHWIVTIETSDTPGDPGFHTSDNNQPSASVRFADDWSVRVSHEILEMLADPFGNTLQAGPAIDNPTTTVQYLVEVCDPCEKSTYQINGTAVADFYTRQYLDPVSSPNARYSFTGSILQPREVLPGGYVSWFDPGKNQWFQLQLFGEEPETVAVDSGAFDGGSLRECIDRATRTVRAVRPRRGVAQRITTKT